MNDIWTRLVEDMGNISDKPDKATSDLVVGLVTFVVFVLFMTVWMYFGTVDC